MLGELCGDVQLRYIQMRAPNARVDMRTILGAISINKPSAHSSTLPLLSVVFLLRSLRFVPNPEPDFREKAIEIGITRIEYVVIEFMIGTLYTRS